MAAGLIAVAGTRLLALLPGTLSKYWESPIYPAFIPSWKVGTSHHVNVAAAGLPMGNISSSRARGRISPASGFEQKELISFEKFQLNRSFAVHLIYQGTGARRRTRGRPRVIRNAGIQEIYAFETQFPNAVPPRRLTGNYSEPEAGFWRVGRFVWSLPIRGG